MSQVLRNTMLSLLKDIEWKATVPAEMSKYYGMPWCLDCSSLEAEGHQADCRVYTLIRDLSSLGGS